MLSVSEDVHRESLRDQCVADLASAVDRFAREFDIDPAEALEQLKLLLDRQITVLQMRKGTYRPE